METYAPCKFEGTDLNELLQSNHKLNFQTQMKKIFTFGDGKAEGDASMRNTLGGKGANLAEMNKLDRKSVV